MENIKINTPFIKLDQFLKYSNTVSDGSDAKHVIINGYVSVNGDLELRRGKKLYAGDIVRIVFENDDISLKVCY